MGAEGLLDLFDRLLPEVRDCRKLLLALGDEVAALVAVNGVAALKQGGAGEFGIGQLVAGDDENGGERGQHQAVQRLARALVSDMIAYLPQKREEGLKNGTLKQLFREEIKKSYEEYVEQIGKEMAESTLHFQDALNDILADGRQIF